jgi:hypothetical protein
MVYYLLHLLSALMVSWVALLCSAMVDKKGGNKSVVEVEIVEMMSAVLISSSWVNRLIRPSWPLAGPAVRASPTSNEPYNCITAKCPDE